MLRIYIIGLLILIVAIAANVIANALGASTWYSFIDQIVSKGFGAFKDAGFVNLMWLFLLYPLTLGFGYWIGDVAYSLLNSFIAK